MLLASWASFFRQLRKIGSPLPSVKAPETNGRSYFSTIAPGRKLWRRGQFIAATRSQGRRFEEALNITGLRRRYLKVILSDP